MKIKLIAVGKTNEPYVREGFANYASKISHYTNFEFIEIPDVKRTSSSTELVENEAEKILRHISRDDFAILLDEHGKMPTSRGFAELIEQKMVHATKSLVFIIGGAYGVSEKVKQQVQMKLSLSKMTFPHQLIRLIFAEQLYRAMTILRNEPYHHD